MKFRTTPTPPKLRQEIFSLGGRHRGDALGGARLELAEPGLDAERRLLLEAVVKHLSAPVSGGAKTGGAVSWASASLPDVFYLAVILAAAVWSASILGAHLG